MTRTTRHTARALVLHDGFLLVVRAQGENFVHLPGGGIDAGEQPEYAVFREVQEEIGAPLSSLAFVAMVENDWDTAPVHEVMSLYRATLWPLLARMVTPAQETGLTAQWVPWFEVDRVNLQPRAVYPWLARVAGVWRWA